MGRTRFKGDSSRAPGRFVALPDSVLDSAAYLNLSHTARSLLLEFARQATGGNNNGRLLASDNYLAGRGWRSPAVHTRARKELIAAGLVYQTIQGQRPNKASNYAVTWYSLADGNYDPGAREGFRRGMYAEKTPPKPSQQGP